jgi:hypothetical protein
MLSLPLLSELDFWISSLPQYTSDANQQLATDFINIEDNNFWVHSIITYLSMAPIVNVFMPWEGANPNSELSKKHKNNFLGRTWAYSVPFGH